MECNRDEALRAKSIAENKLEKKEFAGAKKIAMKAQALYPELDGISQFLTTLDVYISAENKISGEVDWYGVLNVNPSADDDTIKKQYRKLALILHPDKNKSVGADGAFKLISEAWSMLSDKSRRLMYNQRRGIGNFRPVHNSGPSAQPRPNGTHKFTSRATTSIPKTHNTTKPPHTKPTPTRTPTPTPTPTPAPAPAPAPAPPASPGPSDKRTDTFWTICHRCKMHYEYLKMYLNSTLLCPNCKKAFMAAETSSPYKPNQVPRSQQQAPPREHVPNSRKTIPVPPKPEHDPLPPKPGHHPVPPKPGHGQASSKPAKSAKFQKVQLSGTASQDPSIAAKAASVVQQAQDKVNRGTGVGSKDPSIAVKAASVVQQAQEKLKRTYTESNSTGNWEEYLKKIKLDHDKSRPKMPPQGNGTFGTTSATVPGSRTHGISGGFGTTSATAPGSKIHVFNRPPINFRDLTPLERNMLIGKARKDILTRLEMWKSERAMKALGKEKEITNKESKKERTKDTHQEVNSKVNADKTSNSNSPEAAINVPDPDFHDFDLNRSENSFEDNEVWAAYDDDDGMPRFYALVNKVLSTDPFKLRVSWLNSKSTTEFSSIDWVSSGFYKTCGEFRVGKYVIRNSVNSFSHKIKWTKNQRGIILIYPQKDDVWALYTNWSPDWNANTPDEVIHKYEMVTVLDEYNDKEGISVAPLVKVVGFKTVFRPNLDPKMIKKIPKEEMFRFSHRVPHHYLTGEEAENAPKGCLELDPAATPVELLQVITEDKEVPVVNIAEKSTDSEMVNGIAEKSGDKG